MEEYFITLSMFRDECIIMQGVFLNLLWAVLFFVWLSSIRDNPKFMIQGGAPAGVHWLIAGIVWAGTLYVALSELEPIHWIFGIAIANGVFLSVLTPSFSLCFSLAMLLIRPWEIMLDNIFVSALPRFSVLFSFGWGFFYYLLVDRFAIRTNKVVNIVLAFSLWTLLSTFATPDPGLARSYWTDTIFRSMTLFLLIYHLARDRFAVWSIKTTLLGIFSCIGLISIYLFLNGYRVDNRIVAFGLFENTNDIAAVMTMFLPLALAPWLRAQKDIVKKLISLIPVGICLLVLYFAQSRGAILSVIAMGGVFAFKKIKRKMLAVGLLLAFLLGGQLVVSSFKRDTGDLQGSSSSRMSFWKSGLRMGVYNPLFGVGIGEFSTNFESYASEIVGEYGHRTAHSSWILAWGESGPIGFLLFFLAFFYGGVKNARILFEEDPTWMYSVFSYGTAISFLSHTYLVFPYVLIAIITAAVSVKECEMKQ